MLFDKQYKAVLVDEFGSRDISDELNSLAAIELALEREDFQMMPCKMSGVESVCNEARDRIIKRFSKGADLDKPAYIELYKDGEVVSVHNIDDMTTKINQHYASFDTKEQTLWGKIVANKDTKYEVKGNCTLKDNVRVYSLKGNYTSAGQNIQQWARGNAGAYTLPIRDGGDIKGYPLLEGDGILAPDTVTPYWRYRNGPDGGDTHWHNVIFAPSYQQLSLTFNCFESYKMWGLSWDGDRLGGVNDISLSTAKNLGIAIMYWRKGTNQVGILPEWVCQVVYEDYDVTAPGQQDSGDDYRFRIDAFSNKVIETPLFEEGTYYWLAVRVGYNDGSATKSTTPPTQNTSNTSYGWQASGEAFDSGKHIRLAAVGIAGSIQLIRGVIASTIQHAINEVVKKIDNTATVQWDLDLMRIKPAIRWTELLVNPAVFDLNKSVVNKEIVRVSIFDLLKTLDVNYCIGIEELPDNVLRIADRQKILRPYPAKDLWGNEGKTEEITDYADLQIEVDSQRFFNKISVGSDKGIDKDAQGRQDFHGLSEYTIPKTRNKDTVYDLKQIYYTNPLGISNYLVERNTNSQEEEERDNPKDTEIFLFCGWQAGNNLYYIYKDSSSTDFPRPAGGLVEVVTDPAQNNTSTEIYNVPISPLRTLERHANFISGSLHFFRTPPVFKQDTSAVTQDFKVSTRLKLVELAGALRNEKVTQYTFAGAAPFTEPIKVSCQTDLTYHDKLNLRKRNDPLLIKTNLLTSDFQNNTSNLFFKAPKGLLISPMGLSFNLCENTVSEVSGQLLTENETNFYLYTYCRKDIFS